MPEAKNTFLKAKMNQDLDDRLLPNGEYRTAQNVLVGKSEEDSVGTLQNIKGNEILDSLTRPANSFIIGYLMDTTSNRIFAFFTDNADNHSIRVHTINNVGGGWNILAEGAFLNFNTNFPILNINLLEDLLFWTDNNNQPRKINVTHSPGYYTEEHQISVAKYNPYEPISLVKQEIEEVISATNLSEFEVAENAGITEGMIVLSKRGSASEITAVNYITVQDATTTNGITTVTLSSAAPSINAGDIMYFLSSTMTDQSANASWPGDPSYLESRFVRFSYRFKFDDNEYSIFAPFTQIAFIPKQKGYFVNGQEQLAVNSTILEWFENGINNIELIVPLPDTTQNIFSSYKIKEIDILYKESDQIPVKIIDTISVTDIPSSSNNYYTYSYQSRKPVRTLPEAQTVRVYDKVPVKANTQEVVSNRVVYGNFKTKHTPPDTINYTVNIEEKRTNGGFNSFAEYPNHTVKQNRTYQVGFVLSDKYGRQSDVILSPVSESSDNKGSTIFAPYIPEDPSTPGVPDQNYMPYGVKDWFGNSLILTVQSAITGTDDTKLYAEEIGSGFNIDTTYPPIINGNTYSFTLSGTDTAGIPQEGYYMRGNTKDYVKITTVTPLAQSAYEVITDGQVSNVYLKNTEIVSPLEDTKFTYKINPLGWYSYKIVVKQTEQEYYNVYLPSAINANNFPTTKTTDTAASVSYIALINDNINKVPRDLAEVGPDQKQYRSSVRLFGRVQPNVTGTSPSFVYGNNQYFPLRTADTSTAVGNTDDILGDATTAPSAGDAVFQYDSNPIVARISTNKQFGIKATNFSGDDRFSLAVYETEPVVSALDIYWETSQAGLISDLNAKTSVGFNGPVGLEGWEDLFNENVPAYSQGPVLPASGAVTEYFSPLKADGTNLNNFTINIHSITDGNNDSVTGKFQLEQNPSASNEYRIILLQDEVFNFNSDNVDEYTFTFRITDDDTLSTWVSADVVETLKLKNTEPSFNTQPAGTFYNFDEEATTNTLIHNFGNNFPRNGSASLTGNTEGLRWSISGTNAYLFTINPVTGELKPTAAGVAAGLNTYSIDVTLADASNTNQSLGTGSESVTQTYNIVKGFTQWNGTQQGVPFGATFTFDPTQCDVGCYTEQYHCFYMTNSTSIAASDLPSFFGSGTYGANPATGENWQTPEKIAAGHERGAFLFGMEKARIFNLGLNCNATQKVDLFARAYYRTSGSSTWILQNDLNNINSLGIDIQQKPSVEFNLGYAWYAQDRDNFPAANYIEWAFVTRSIGTDNRFYPRGPGCPTPSYGETTSFTALATVRDLHYNSPTQSQAIYEYITWPSGGASSPSNVTYTGNYQTLYSDNPLVETNAKFFTDINLSNIWKPTTDQYYAVRFTTGPGADPPCIGYDRCAASTIWNSTPDGFQVEGIMKIKTNGEVDRTVTPVANAGDASGSTPIIRLSNDFNTRITDCNNTNTYFEEQLTNPGP